MYWVGQKYMCFMPLANCKQKKCFRTAILSLVFLKILERFSRVGWKLYRRFKMSNCKCLGENVEVKRLAVIDRYNFRGNRNFNARTVICRVVGCPQAASSKNYEHIITILKLRASSILVVHSLPNVATNIKWLQHTRYIMVSISRTVKRTCTCGKICNLYGVNAVK